jgi:sugar transferase EpsL
MKRAIDLLIAVPAFFIASPIWIIIAFLIKMKMGNPIYFIQTRPGLNGTLFKMYKFRSMTNKCDANGNILPDADRLIPLGQFLRSSSLDELPELYNVIKGEMSIVGPRPLLTKYLKRYTPEQARRHAVRPGITGWAQINGRNAITWEKKFILDVWYVDNQTFWLDLKIIALTIYKILKREAINQPGHATAEEFMGEK